MSFRSPARVVKEVGRVWREVGRKQRPVSADGRFTIEDNTAIYFVDDVFTLKPARAVEIMRGIAELGMDIPWKCESRADNITDEVARTMAATGCARVKVGVESGSDRILHQMHKGETVDQIRRGIRLLQKYDIPVTAYLMAGFPGETDDDLQKTIAFARELDVDYYSISILAPYPGSQVYRDAVAGGRGLDRQPWEYFYHHNRALMLNHDLSLDLLDELWGLCDVRKYR